MSDTAARSLRSLTGGLFFEDFAVGDSIKSAARTITEADIVAFAALSGDWNAIHTDAEFAGQGMFGGRIAHGLLGLSVASGLAMRLGFLEDTTLAFLGLEWKFKLPIMIGDTIHLTATVSNLRAVRRLGGGVVEFGVELLNQRGQVVQLGSWSMLIKSRPALGSTPATPDNT
jgi:3-hydroxybutyryl-CoA dehydratase